MAHLKIKKLHRQEDMNMVIKVGFNTIDEESSCVVEMVDEEEIENVS